jgi:phage shock protein PspC (stress-responsive transcriptional regulator)
MMANVSNLADRRLQRPVKGRMIAGVAAGFAEYFGLDPVLVRVVLVVVTLIAGVGVLIYLAGWLLIPEEGEQASILEKLASKPGS